MNSQRLLIIGARGFFGTYAARAAAGKFDVIRGERDSNGESGAVLLDIRDASSVDDAFAKVRPDSVLLLAAISDIDKCEAVPELAFATNAKGAQNVASACARTNARLLFTSTGAVFDGKKHGYSEQDEALPLSVYGKTKAWAEEAVKAILPESIILRFALVLGFARKNGTNAMLDRIFEKWNTDTNVEFSTREMRNPIDAESLSNIMIGMLSSPGISGTFHIGSSDSITRFELGKKLAARAGVRNSLVSPQDAPAPGRAPRGEDQFLLTDKLSKAYGFKPITCDQVIERCFR